MNNGVQPFGGEWKEWTLTPAVIIGTVGSAVALVSLIKRGYNIDLRGIAAIIYDGYVWIRELIFMPVPISITWKDLIAGYWLMGVALARAMGDEQEDDIPILEKIMARLIGAAIWPLLVLHSLWEILTDNHHFDTPRSLGRWLALILATLGIAGAFFGLNYLSS